MSARTKLNQAYLLGWAVLGAFIGLSTGSTRFALIAFAVLALAGLLGGDFRLSSSRSNFRR